MKALLRSLLVVLALAAPVHLANAAGPWQSLGPDGGWFASGLAFDVDGQTLYAGSGHAGVFRSADGGRSWSPASAGLPSMDVQSIAVDPVAPGTLYAWFYAKENDVAKSTDGGRSWHPAAAGLDTYVWSFAIDPHQHRTLYAGTSNGVYRSFDGGATWKRAGHLPGTVVALAADPQRKGWIYAGNERGVYKSVDGGASWSYRPLGKSRPSIAKLLVDPSRPDTVYAGSYRGPITIYFSRNAGKTWHPARGGVPPQMQALAADASRPGTVFAGTYASPDNLYRSDDYGLSWTVVPIQLGDHGGDYGVTAIALDPRHPGVLHVGIAGDDPLDHGVVRTADDGLHWVEENRGFHARFIQTLAIDPRDGTLVAGSDRAEGIFVSHDHGATWAPSDDGLSGFDLYVLNLRFAPSNPSVLWAATRGGVFRSDDGGTHWVERSDGVISPDDPVPPFGFDVSPTNPDIAWVGGKEVIFRTEDGGLHWVPSHPLPGTQILDIAAAASDPSRVYASGLPNGAPADQLYRSEDGGRTWIPSGLTGKGLQAVVVDRADADHVWAAGDGLFESTDGGATWTPLQRPTPAWIADLECDAAGRLYVLTGPSPLGFLFRSGDDGETWQRLDRGLGQPFLINLTLDPAAPATLYATGEGGVWRR
jgi:photosystem II stability/assembly factor-like uncharacterized protein